MSLSFELPSLYFWLYLKYDGGPLEIKALPFKSKFMLRGVIFFIGLKIHVVQGVAVRDLDLLPETEARRHTSAAARVAKQARSVARTAGGEEAWVAHFAALRKPRKP